MRFACLPKRSDLKVVWCTLNHWAFALIPLKLCHRAGQFKAVLLKVCDSPWTFVALARRKLTRAEMAVILSRYWTRLNAWGYSYLCFSVRQKWIFSGLRIAHLEIFEPWAKTPTARTGASGVVKGWIMGRGIWEEGEASCRIIERFQFVNIYTMTYKQECRFWTIVLHSKK